MKIFYPEEIRKMLGGKLITPDNGRPVQIFTTQPDDKPLPGSFHFLFDGCSDEDGLLKEMMESSTYGLVVRENHGFNIDKWKNAGISVIEIPHMTGPYIKLAKAYRSQFNIPFIEVIGSSGKTTTKEMIGAILKENMPTLVSLKNYNAPSGAAYNIFCLRDNHKAAVLEAGMKAKGIIEYTSSIIRPDIAVVTSIHRAHLVDMGSIENIISAKAEILKCISKQGTLIINGEDENCRKFPLEGFEGEVLRFGFSDEYDIYAKDIRYRNFKTYFKAAGKGFEIDCVIKTVGRFNILNALAAIMVGLKLDLKPEEITAGLSKFKTLNGRLKLYKGLYGMMLIDDNFNANPDSTRQLIEEVPHFAGGRPVVLVMGDMERGDENIRDYAREVHNMIGEEISKITPKYLVAVGKWAEAYINGAVQNGYPADNTAYFDTVSQAKEHICKYVVPGGIMLFKASVYTNVSKLIKPLRLSVPDN